MVPFFALALAMISLHVKLRNERVSQSHNEIATLNTKIVVTLH
jgi:hypothetical protein